MTEREESETVVPSANWLVRAYYTPLSDALRGRLSGRLDVRGEIAAADLPRPVSALVWRVVRRARLWRAERHDVARELVAHFADGLAAGRTARELVTDFGDERAAARMIRQAKLRNRPLWWQAWHLVSRVFLAALVVGIVGYSVLAARFYFGRPEVAHNYWNDVDAGRRVPEDQQAWPLYQLAVSKLRGVVAEHARPDTNWFEARPGSDDWKMLVDIVEHSGEAIELARQGAGKPRLGVLLGSFGGNSPDFYSLELNHLMELRELARLLVADARLAGADDDGARAMQDLVAVVSMAEQIDEPHAIMVEQLVRVSVFTSAAVELGAMLNEHPQLFSEPQLRDLAHCIAAYRGGSTEFDVSAEQFGFEDLLQRIYTDDGHGDGRITLEGVQRLDAYGASGQLPFTDLARAAADDWRISAGFYALGPGVAAMIGGRRENSDLYQSLLDQIVRAHQGPPWQWDRAEIDGFDDRIWALTRSTSAKLRYLPVWLLIPAFNGGYNVVEREAQIRDATEVAIALVLWHRRHEAWPERLDELVPDLLPAVPPDRVDGQPLRYAVIDGKPVVYSVGMDRDDDGGRGVDRDRAGTWLAPIEFGRPADKHKQRVAMPENDGDWILWPPVE